MDSFDLSGGAWVPKRVLSELKKVVDKKENCAICIEPVTFPAAVLECGHVYHPDCIRRALGVNPSCPECRGSASHFDEITEEGRKERVAVSVEPADREELARRVEDDARVAAELAERYGRGRVATPRRRRVILEHLVVDSEVRVENSILREVVVDHFREMVAQRRGDDDRCRIYDRIENILAIGDTDKEIWVFLVNFRLLNNFKRLEQSQFFRGAIRNVLELVPMPLRELIREIQPQRLSELTDDDCIYWVIKFALILFLVLEFLNRKGRRFNVEEKFRQFFKLSVFLEWMECLNQHSCEGRERDIAPLLGEP